MLGTSVRVDIDNFGSDTVCTVYSADLDGQWRLLGCERFGPSETAYDLLQWSLRLAAPVLHLPLR